MTKICKNCNAENENKSKYCKECGETLVNSHNEKIGIKKASNSLEKIRKWWNRQHSGVKGLTILGSSFLACCISLFFLVSLFGLLTPDSTPADSNINKNVPDSQADINTTTESSSDSSSDSDSSYLEDYELGYDAGLTWGRRDVSYNEWPAHYPEWGGDYPAVVQDKSSDFKSGYNAGYLDALKEAGLY